MRVFFLGLIVALTSLTAVHAHNADGTHTHWDVTYVVIEVGGGPPPDVAVPAEMTFEINGRLTGFFGCNSFVGDYDTNGRDFVAGSMAGTRKMCPPAEMDLEALVLDGLSRAEVVSRNGPVLKLLDRGGLALLTLRRKDAP